MGGWSGSWSRAGLSSCYSSRGRGETAAVCVGCDANPTYVACLSVRKRHLVIMIWISLLVSYVEFTRPAILDTQAVVRIDNLLIPGVVLH